MSKATHNGTCQVCGRHHAVNPNTGLLAKHGYRVTWGYFMGTCNGADELPLEFDTTVARKNIKSLNEYADRLEAKCEAGDIKTVEVRVRVRTGKFHSHSETRVMNREKFLEYREGLKYGGKGETAWNAAVLNEISRLQLIARNCYQAAKDIETRIEKVHGGELIEREPQDAPKSHRETFQGFKRDGRLVYATHQAYDRQRELKAQGIRSRVTGDSRHATITWKA